MRLKFGFTLIVVVFLSGCMTHIDYFADRFFLPSEDIREPEYIAVTERDRVLHTTDDIELIADIHRPKRLMKTPTILVRIPFTNTVGNRIRSDILNVQSRINLH